ncbi:MAG: CDP-alcohol phosphatidyltransferase family protein [Chthoniobacterales bacterium]
MADESAYWKVAGLRQLDRLLLALNELALARDERIRVFLEWASSISPRDLAPDARLTNLDFTANPAAPPDLLLSTRIFLNRVVLSGHQMQPSVRSKSDFAERIAAVRDDWIASAPAEGWEYLETPAQIPDCERRFLRRSGKAHDGLVSRFLNRPVSRALTRILLRFPITPSAWTLSIFVLPILGSMFLARGSYGNVIIGLLVFQLYSILDGCDGEIARAKYLESARGRRLDTWCDVIGNLFLVLALGYGLSRPVEAVFVAILIATNEIVLALAPASTRPLPAASVSSAVYPRHQQLLERSGLLFIGPRFTGWLIHLTKRDVALLFFVFLALAGQSAWILHLLGAVAAISTLLALKARSR